MSVKTYVGFVADFPAEPNGDNPPGQELAAFVAQRLKNAAFAVDDLGDRDGWAWDLCTKDDELEIMSVVGLVDDMDDNPPRQWLITNDCELGLFKRFLGAKGLAEKREQFLRNFCNNLHQIISADARFSHIVWYNKETFDKPDDQPGDTP